MKTDRAGKSLYPCTVCDKDTSSPSNFCDSCWLLDQSFKRLLNRSRVKAHDWLHARVAELAGYT